MSDNNGIHHFMSINETNNNSEKKLQKWTKPLKLTYF